VVRRAPRPAQIGFESSARVPIDLAPRQLSDEGGHDDAPVLAQATGHYPTETGPGRRRLGIRTGARGLRAHDWTCDTKNPPQMGRGDLVLLHAVIHARVFAAGEILGNPRWEPHRQGGDRWPYVYPCRIDVWVPLVNDGPRTPDIAPKKALGRIQLGAPYAPLTTDEYKKILDALLASPTVHTRSSDGA
jgi:hypothetical protein